MGFRSEFGIGARDPNASMMGLPNDRKSRKHRFSGFDTIPALTDSHPASHVAVAKTPLYYVARRAGNKLITLRDS